ncbi:MAG TPA: hypothetical protein PKC83_11090 [Gemmatimonadaceae bacterium]|nr:hypothetical protein [Gemmatimonadaceae bacterium]
MRRVSLAGLIVLVALLTATIGAAEVVAQTQVPSPTPASTRIAWDHDGLNTDRYELVVDGKVTDLGKLTPANGTTYEVPFPALTPGPHTLVLQACNVAGCAASPPFPVSVIVQPSAPSPLRIVTR